jgi:hypothetical protein
MKVYEVLELQIKELQEEVDRLKKEEADKALPLYFNREFAEYSIRVGFVHYLTQAFDWGSTNQGLLHWADIRLGKKPMTDKDIICIQNWIILSLQQEQK